MRKRMWTAGLTALLSAAFFLGFPQMSQAAPVFPQGITADGQSLAGQTPDEAEETLKEHIDSMGSQKIILTVDGKKAETTAADLGFHWKNTGLLEEAAKEYTGGSLVKQYMTRRDLEKTPVELPVETGIDAALVKQFVAEKCEGAGLAAQDASITRENGAFVVTDSVVGKEVDVKATEDALNEALKGGLGEMVQAEAVMKEQLPAISSEDLKTINDVLGTCTTDFSSSGAARSTNLKVGAEKINGHVLMPGEVLSGYECLQPFTAANGYKAAGAYENGRVVDSIGGGVCQISTTLYNAALQAELEIVQRQNHSMVVGYVKPSMDAAIAGTYKDLKVKNNYDTPIYVEAYTSGKTITFTIYGKETRPANRKVEYISQTIGSTDPGEPQLIPDASLAPGARVKVQSSHTGLRSQLWKVVTVDGVEQERTLLNKDTYNASKAIYRVGPDAPAVPAETAPVETPAETEVTPVPVTGENGGPGVSPQVTPAPVEEPQEVPQ